MRFAKNAKTENCSTITYEKAEKSKNSKTDNSENYILKNKKKRGKQRDTLKGK